MTQKEVYQKLRLYNDYAENYLKIRDDDGKVLFFKLNSIQQKVYRIIQGLQAQNEPVRLVVLKARQQGISTFVEGLIFHDSATRLNRRSLIVSHEPDSTDHLFDMCKNFYDNLPEWLTPTIHRSNRKNLVFEQFDAKTKRVIGGLSSRIDVITASKKEPRSKTLSNFHGSEVAFWERPERFMTGAMQMIPDKPDTTIILESTANGIGGYFYDIFWDAWNKKNNFTAIFLPWHEFAEYSRPLESADFTLTEDEKKLKLKYNLTDEQVNWRRFTIRNKCRNDMNVFHQEYPMTPEEAFISSGSPKFNVENLRIMYNHRKPPQWIGDINGKREPQLLQNSQGRLKIYHYPNPRHKYAIGGDTAKGTINSDYSCLQVYDAIIGDFVATWHGKVDPTNFEEIAASLGYYYRGNDVAALIAIEVNKDGITTNKQLYYNKYPRLYRRRNLLKRTEDQDEVIGFHTNETSRPLILNLLGEFINNGQGEMNDETTLKECMTFVITESGKPEAQEGCHDDTVISAAIALHAANYTPEDRPKQTTEDRRKIEIEKRGSEEDQFWRNKRTKNQNFNW